MSGCVRKISVPHEPLTEPVQGLSEEGGGGRTEVDVIGRATFAERATQRGLGVEAFPAFADDEALYISSKRYGFPHNRGQDNSPIAKPPIICGAVRPSSLQPSVRPKLLSS